MGQLQYDLKVALRSYRRCSLRLWTANFLILLCIGVFVFALLTTQPSADWEQSRFSLEGFRKWMPPRSDGQLLLYGDDSWTYVVNDDLEDVQQRLACGRMYEVVYEERFGKRIVYGLSDSAGEFIRLKDSQAHADADRGVFCLLILFAAGAFVAINGLYVPHHIRAERIRMQKWKNG